MSALMDLFNGELQRFREDCKEEELLVDFIEGTYPQKIVIRGGEVWEQQSFDGVQPTKKKQPEIIVAGDVNGTICVQDVQMRKKDLTKLIGKAEKLLELYLHAFCQDVMEERKQAE